MNQKYITVDIPSSKKNYPLRIPDNGRVMVASTPEFHDLPDQKDLVREALDNPIGTSRIEEMVKPGNKICIISDPAYPGLPSIGRTSSPVTERWN